MQNVSDEALILRVQEGNVSSYEILVSRYQQRLFLYAYRMIKSPEDAQDAVQMAFIHVYEHIERFDTKRSFSAYIYSVTKNEAISILRKKKYHIPLDTVEVVDEKKAIDEQLVEKERSGEVEKTLRRLDKKYEKVLRLYYFDELSYQEMGRRLSIPINTVRTLIRRGKAAFKKLY
jgi:RNA polymerase sigma-70 factor, ECF subfamily